MGPTGPGAAGPTDPTGRPSGAPAAHPYRQLPERNDQQQQQQKLAKLQSRNERRLYTHTASGQDGTRAEFTLNQEQRLAANCTANWTRWTGGPMRRALACDALAKVQNDRVIRED